MLWFAKLRYKDGMASGIYHAVRDFLKFIMALGNRPWRKFGLKSNMVRESIVRTMTQVYGHEEDSIIFVSINGAGFN